MENEQLFRDTKILKNIIKNLSKDKNNLVGYFSICNPELKMYKISILCKDVEEFHIESYNNRDRWLFSISEQGLVQLIGNFSHIFISNLLLIGEFISEETYKIEELRSELYSLQMELQ